MANGAFSMVPVAITLLGCERASFGVRLHYRTEQVCSGES
jgi:hypothetical protein